MTAADDELQHTEQPLPEGTGLLTVKGFCPLAQHAGQLDAEQVGNAPDEKEHTKDEVGYHSGSPFCRGMHL